MVMDNFRFRAIERWQKLAQENPAAYNAQVEARNAGKAAGSAVTKAREIANLPPIEAVEESAKHATICGQCLRPLKPQEPVKICSVGGKTDPAAFEKKRKECPALAPYMRAPPPVVYYDAPVCIACWLTVKRDAMQSRFYRPPRYILLGRCDGCGRPIRIEVPAFGGGIRFMRRASQKGCCTDCDHQIELKRLRAKRKVKHAIVKCAVCHKPFVQTRSDAVTCSAKCRQKVHRDKVARETTQHVRATG
jgi:hypothetical protein